MKQNIKKGISYIAFGFLFTLVNINLTISGTEINIMPDCVGWILFFLAIDELGEYSAGKTYLKWISLVLAIFTGAFWILGIMMPETDLSVFRSAVNLVSAFCIFMILGIVEMIAMDYGSRRAGTIGFLRWFSMIIFLALSVLGLLALRVIPIEPASIIVAVLGAAAIIAAIITLFTLFGLRREINESF